MDFQSPADVAMANQNSMSSSSSSIDRFSPSQGDLSGTEEDEFGDETPSVSPSPKRFLYPKREFVEKLRPEEIRWFFKHQGGKKWVSFIGYDSLRIECRYRVFSLPDCVDDFDEEEKILVRGGLYEVDVCARKCSPVYWDGESTQIMRGLWFEGNNWQPIEEEYASDIEVNHFAKFAGRRLESASTENLKGPNPVIFHMKFKDFHVDWNSTDEVYKFNESASSKFLRNVQQSFGWKKSGIRLHRGYCYEASMEDKPPDICHLVFVIHGIGQKMDTESIVRCTRKVRENVAYMRSKMFQEFDKTSRRAEFLPVQWRSSLRLDGDTVESITPNKMKGVRNILNSSVMDILYYTSPLYRSEITNTLKLEISRLYQMFCARHPYFEPSNGKVSILSHSLGSVISYDIITGWNPVHTYDQLIGSLLDAETEDAHGNTEILADVEVAKNKVKDLEDLMTNIREKQGSSSKRLPFKVENLFCIGSPLAVFLALRGLRPEGTGSHDHIISSKLCGRLFNIFHPSDPVAYRLEPLILKHYSTIMPLSIYNFSAPKKMPYSKIPRRAYAALTGVVEEMTQKNKGMDGATSDVLGLDDTSDPGIEIKSQKFSFSLSTWLNNRKKKEAVEKLSAELQTLNKINKESEENEVIYTEEGEMDKTELEYRLDFQLKEQLIENSYLSVLTSHTNYWTNKDVAYFLLAHLHSELQEESM